MTQDEIKRLIDAALKRSEPLVRDALKLGRSLSTVSAEDLRLVLR